MAAPSDLAARRANVLRNIAVGPPVFSLLLAALYTAALATYLSADTARILPALTVVFFLARLVFWRGYLKNPLTRAAGMAGTFLVNFAVHGGVVYTVRTGLGL